MAIDHQAVERPHPRPGPTSIPVNSNADLNNYLESIERAIIQKALAKASHNKTAAAKLLGISFRALRYRLKKLGMD